MVNWGNLLLLIIAASLASCKVGADYVPLWINGKPMNLIDDELEGRNREYLEKGYFNSAYNADIKLVIIVDATVTEIELHPNLSRKVKVDIKNILNGSIAEAEITILTPSYKKGGVIFEKDKLYRIVGIPYNGRYLTWRATGTYECTHMAIITRYC